MTVTTGRAPQATNVRRPPERLPTTVTTRLASWLAERSVILLRVSLGLVFLGFGVLKFIPGASLAEALVVRTIDTLTVGVVSGTTAVVVTAVLETSSG